MQLAGEAAPIQSFATAAFAESAPATQSSALSQYKVIRRNGAVVGFEPAKISVAVTKAFLAVSGGQGAASARIRELVAGLTEAVVAALIRRQPQGGTFHIEDIQDQVELALMRSGEHDIARAYVLYREKRAQARATESAQRKAAAVQPVLHVVEDERRPLDWRD
jgi:ribonucleoside-diphosphate reductase alpha chain